MLNFLIPSFFVFLSIYSVACCIIKQEPCDDGWHLFQRPQGGWCVKVFTVPTYLTQLEGAQLCADNNSTLTGIQNREEFDYLGNIVADYKNSTGSRNAGMWLGANKTEYCMTNSCLNQKDTAFTWTDGFTTGTEGFIYDDINPSGNGNCLRLYIALVGPYDDDVPCNQTGLGVQAACGKRSKY